MSKIYTSQDVRKLHLRASHLKKTEDIPHHEALRRIAEGEGHSSWEELAAKFPKPTLRPAKSAASMKVREIKEEEPLEKQVFDYQHNVRVLRRMRELEGGAAASVKEFEYKRSNLGRYFLPGRGHSFAWHYRRDVFLLFTILSPLSPTIWKSLRLETRLSAAGKKEPVLRYGEFELPLPQGIFEANVESLIRTFPQFVEWFSDYVMGYVKVSTLEKLHDYVVKSTSRGVKNFQ